MEEMRRMKLHCSAHEESTHMDGLQAEEEEEKKKTGFENAFWIQLGEEEESDYTLEVVAGEEV
jgi:hypothetical protein